LTAGPGGSSTRIAGPASLRRLPELLTIWVPLLLAAAQIVLFAAWTGWMSFTSSTLMPANDFVGLRNYTLVLGTRNWKIAFDNLLVFGFGFVVFTMLTGLLLAILLDQRIRGENVLRSIFLYPMAVSFVVTGVVWSWLLNPGMGIQKLVNDLGWTGFRFDWLIDREMAIWTIVIAGVAAWPASGWLQEFVIRHVQSQAGPVVFMAGKPLGPLASPGVFARHNAVDTAALLPDGTAAESSVSRVLAARGTVRSAPAEAGNIDEIGRQIEGGSPE